MSHTRKHQLLFYVALILGLALVSVYADLAGHGSGFCPSNALVEETTHLNSRFFFSLGLLSFGIMGASMYHFALKHQKSITIITSLFSLLAVALYVYSSDTFISNGFVGATGAYLIGLTYGWFEAYFLLLLFYTGSYRKLFFTLIVSFIAKIYITRIVGSYGFDIQTAVLFGCPIIMCLTACIIWENLCYQNQGLTPYDTFKENTALTKQLAFVILFSLSVIQSVSRGLSTLGFWGEGNVINNDYVLLSIVAVVCFVSIAYLVFYKIGNDRIELMLGVGFLVLTGGLVLTQITISLGTETSAWLRFMAEVVELFAHSFWLIVIVTVVRVTSINPIKVIGLAEIVLSSTAAVLSYPLSQLSGFGNDIVLMSLYALSVAMMFILYATGTKANSQVTVKTSSAETSLKEVSPASPVPSHSTSDTTSLSNDKDATTSDQVATVATQEFVSHLDEISEAAELSQREREVFDLLVLGRTRKVISEELFISESTVKTHVQNIYAKLNVHSKQELISLVRQSEHNDH